MLWSIEESFSISQYKNDLRTYGNFQKIAIGNLNRVEGATLFFIIEEMKQFWIFKKKTQLNYYHFVSF